LFGRKKHKKEKLISEGKPKAEEKDMGFLDHLGELRTRVIWAFVGLLVGCVIAGVFIQDIVSYVLLQPAVAHGLKLQNLKPFGQPMMYFKLIFIIGIIISFPFMLYQLWRFIAPGLYVNERSWARVITFFTSLCFLTGVAFSYFVMIPSMLNFAANFGTKDIINNIDINEYLGFIGMIILAAGLLFEMPMVVFVLSRFGLVTPKLLRKYRRHSIVLILILAAVITPTPDPISQLIFAAPLFILYELSIIVSKFAAKKYTQKQEENNNNETNDK
jgi:sec-independent protein translocase protein TatC